MNNKMKNIDELDLSSLSAEQLLELEEKIKKHKKQNVPVGFRFSFVLEYKGNNVLEGGENFIDCLSSHIESSLYQPIRDFCDFFDEEGEEVIFHDMFGFEVEELSQEELEHARRYFEE